MKKSTSSVVPSDAVLLSPSSDKKAEKALGNAKRYPHADTRMIWRAGDGKHLIVVVRCACGVERAVFTSDVWQSTACATCRKAAKAPKAKAEKAPRKGARSKDAPKGTRKARGEKKATRKARKANVASASQSAE